MAITEGAIDNYVNATRESLRRALRDQRRYEIARDCMAHMAGLIPDKLFIEAGLAAMKVEEATHAEIFAEAAVAYADQLLIRLERE